MTELPYVGFEFDQATATNLGAMVVEVDDSGRFLLPASGDRVLCRLEEGTEELFARGCDEVSLPGRGELRVTLGEGGFQVSVQ